LLTDIRHVLGLGATDHAVVVSGFDTSDPRDFKVIVSDPGTGKWPLDIRRTSSSRRGKRATSSWLPPRTAARKHASRGNETFDYTLGHIDHVGEMSYDNFQQLLHDQAHSSGSAADLHHHVEQFISGVLPGSDEAPPITRQPFSQQHIIASVAAR